MIDLPITRIICLLSAFVVVWLYFFEEVEEEPNEI